MPEKPQDWKIRQYYSRDGVQERMLGNAEYREMVPTYESGFGHRPDAVNFPGDLEQFVEDGAVAFHGSVEHWRNPLLIDESDQDALRSGWDLVIDIDCDPSFELAKDTARLLVDTLENQFGIEAVGVKFSGNRGFHISVPKSAFPDKVDDQEISDLYPRLPKACINVLREEMEEEMRRLVRKHGLEEQMSTSHGTDPYQVADLENNWGSRHLFRMPYSLHDSSWLVSLPIPKDEIQAFEKSQAEISEVEVDTEFFHEPDGTEAGGLAVEAMDWLEEHTQDADVDTSGEFDAPEEAIDPEHWPPTIHNILEGLEDGRKRALLILVNFLQAVGYDFDDIEERIWRWNKENDEPLNEPYVRSQLSWHRRQDEIVPPPNYDSDGYYRDIQVYEGSDLEEKVANPVSYAFRKSGESRNSSEDQQNSSGNSSEEEELVCPYCGKEYEIEAYYRDHVRKCFG